MHHIVIFENENDLKKLQSCIELLQKKYPNVTRQKINVAVLALYLLPNIEVLYQDTYVYHPDLHTKAQYTAYLKQHPHAYVYDIATDEQLDLLKALDENPLPDDQTGFGQPSLDRFNEYMTDVPENQWLASELLTHDQQRYYQPQRLEKMLMITPQEITTGIRELRQRLTILFPQRLAFPQNSLQQTSLYRIIFPMYRFNFACYSQMAEPVLLIPKALITANPHQELSDLILAFLNKIQKEYRVEIYDGMFDEVKGDDALQTLLDCAHQQHQEYLPLSFDKNGNSRSQYTITNRVGYGKNKHQDQYQFNLFLV